MSNTDQVTESAFCQLFDRVSLERAEDPQLALKQAHDVAEQSAVESILSSCDFEEEALNSVRLGRKMCRLMTWEGRGPQYRGLFLSDMLDLGALVSRLQDHFDRAYGDGRFLVFNHQVAPTGPKRFMTLAVSWDTDRFENAREILANNRNAAQSRESRRNDPEHHGDKQRVWMPSRSDRPQRNEQQRDYRPQQRDYNPQQRPGGYGGHGGQRYSGQSSQSNQPNQYHNYNQRGNQRNQYGGQVGNQHGNQHGNQQGNQLGNQQDGNQRDDDEQRYSNHE